MKRIFLSLIVICQFLYVSAQRVMTEGTIIYDVSATGGTTQDAGNVFNGSTLTVYIKGNQVLQELKTAALNQFTIYDGKYDTAVILKQFGTQKFIINLDAGNWKAYNQRYEGIKYDYTEETKNVAGFACKKATTKLADSTSITVYYATSLTPIVKGYDYQFKDLPGVALEYEVQHGPVKVTYSATKVLFNPVPAFKFDIPKSGYRILEYKSS